MSKIPLKEAIVLWGELQENGLLLFNRIMEAIEAGRAEIDIEHGGRRLAATRNRLTSLLSRQEGDPVDPELRGPVAGLDAPAPSGSTEETPAGDPEPPASTSE